jgi:FkbM family methyltransferase
MAEDFTTYESRLPFIKVTYKSSTILFAVPNAKCLYFAKSINTREADTNKWLESLRHDDVFFDVGANNGVFALIASKIYGCKSYAFEPHYASYFILQQNIYANKLENLVTLYPLAISKDTTISNLYLSSKTAGKSLNQFGSKLESSNHLWNAVIPQGSVSMSLDKVSELLGIVPTYLKIDVDGIESSIVKGATTILADKRLKRIMIEFNPEKKEDCAAARTLERYQFSLEQKGPSGYFFERK